MRGRVKSLDVDSNVQIGRVTRKCPVGKKFFRKLSLMYSLHLQYLSKIPDVIGLRMVIGGVGVLLGVGELSQNVDIAKMGSDCLSI